MINDTSNVNERETEAVDTNFHEEASNVFKERIQILCKDFTKHYMKLILYKLI